MWLFSNEKARFHIQGNIADTTHMCIAAHQDDIEIMAASAILECFGKSDKKFTGVTVTDGAGSPRTGIYESFTDEDMKKIRAVEQDTASAIGRYNAQFQLYYPSSAVKDNKNAVLVNELIEIISAASPKFLYMHNFADKHDTHVAVALRTLEALRQIPKETRPQKVYSMEVWRSLDWVRDDEKLLFDTSQDEFLQASLLGVYHSQIAGGKRYDVACLGRKRANATYVATHSTDDYTAAEYGIDITELVNDDSLTPTQFISRFIENFKQDVIDRMAKFSP